MVDKNRSLSAFAKEFAKYSTSAERSDDLISNIEQILGRKLSKKEEFKLRLNIEIFISSIIVYTVSSLDIEADKKIFFASRYKEETNKIFRIFGNWSASQIEDYTTLLNTATGLYSEWAKGIKGIPSQNDYENLWNDFAEIIIISLNVGPQINTENEKQYILLSKNIQLRLVSLAYEVKKKIQENIAFFK